MNEKKSKSLKKVWEKNYEDSLNRAEEQIKKDLDKFRNNLKTIKKMSHEEFDNWLLKWNFPSPLFDQVAQILDREKMQAEQTEQKK